MGLDQKHYINYFIFDSTSITQFPNGVSVHNCMFTIIPIARIPFPLVLLEYR